jgi:hypothetical protein
VGCVGGRGGSGGWPLCFLHRVAVWGLVDNAVTPVGGPAAPEGGSEPPPKGAHTVAPGPRDRHHYTPLLSVSASAAALTRMWGPRISTLGVGSRSRRPLFSECRRGRGPFPGALRLLALAQMTTTTGSTLCTHTAAAPGRPHKRPALVGWSPRGALVWDQAGRINQ